MIAGEQSHLAS